MVGKTDLVVVNTRIGLTESGIGEVLESEANIELLSITKACAHTKVVTKLKDATKLSIAIHEDRGN